jgi:hypothetical protein
MDISRRGWYPLFLPVTGKRGFDGEKVEKIL